MQDIMIVETGWPAVCDTAATPLSEPSIPIDPKGQLAWTKGILDILNDVNLAYGHKALGIVYWEPGWIGNAALASGCAVRFFPYFFDLPAC